MGYQAFVHAIKIQWADSQTSVHFERPVLKEASSMTEASVAPHPRSSTSSLLNEGTSALSILSGLEVRLPQRALDMLANTGTISWSDAAIDISGWPQPIQGSGRLGSDKMSSEWTLFDGHVSIDLQWNRQTGLLKDLSANLVDVDLPSVIDALATVSGQLERTDFDPGGTIDMVFSVSRKQSDVDDITGDFGWSYDIQVKDGRVFIPSVAETPLTRINLRARGEGQYEDDRISNDGTMELNGLTVSTQLSIDALVNDPHLKFRLRGDEFECQEAIDALPEGLLGAYDHIALKGNMKPRIDLDWPLHEPEKLQLKFKKIISPCTVSQLKTKTSEAPLVRINSRTAKPRQDVKWLNQPFILKVREGTSKARSVLVGPGTKEYV